MPTIRLVPSTYGRSNTTYVTVTNPANMYTNTDSTTYATCTTTRAAATAYYVYIRGFNFDAIPQGAHVTGYTVKVKGYETGLNTSTQYAPSLATTGIHIQTTASSTFGTSVKTITISSTVAWDTLVGYGSNLGIQVTVKRASSGTKGYLYIYGAEIEVTYSYLPQGLGFRIKNNGAWIEPQKIYAKSEGTWHLAKSFYANVGGRWFPDAAMGHSIWVDDYPWDESNPQDPYNNGWAESFYEYASMGEYFDLDQRGSPTGTKYNYVGPMEFNGKIIFLWQAAPDSPGGAPDPSTIKYAATTTNDINLLRSMSVCNYTSSEDMVAAISPGGSALNKIMLLSEDIDTYENFSDNLGGEVLFKVE